MCRAPDHPPPPGNLFPLFLSPSRLRPALPLGTFRLAGDLPPEIWNRLGTKILPKLRSGSDLKIGINFSVTVDGPLAPSFENDLTQILEDLGLTGRIQIIK